MYSESDIDAAVAGGILGPDQAAAFRGFVAAGRPISAVDEEHFRLLTGFNDIFVGLAALILLVAVAWIGQYVPPQIGGDGPSPFLGLFVAVTAWGLAEFFTLKRRMALPSIILTLAFLTGIFVFAAVTIVIAVGESYMESPREVFMVLSASAAITAGAAWLHWRRFKVPITIAAGAAAAVALVIGLVATPMVRSGERLTDAEVDSVHFILEVTALVLGLLTFLFAMWWDASDRRRQTRRSDVAFWLHLLAAPLIVHPVFWLLGLTEGGASIGSAIAVVLLYVVMAVLALAIDRRAILVSALAYVLWAINMLFRESGAVELSVALTALVIGSALLLLSAFWPNARRGVVAPLPEGLQARLPLLDRPATRIVPA
ncbi:MAG TPA: hypothetical protein VEX35_02305 [Allosphingosinicella sp.]|nr:hypothetical protein [Allosphingosinicella sp.]